MALSELFTNFGLSDALSLLGLTLVLIIAYLRIKQLRRNHFTYYTATLFIVVGVKFDSGEIVNFYKETIEGEVLRHYIKTEIWEFYRHKRLWKTLDHEQIELVKEMLSKGEPIKLIIVD